MYKKIMAFVSTICILFSTLTYAEDESLYLSDNIIDMTSGNADYQYNTANEFLECLEIIQGNEDKNSDRYSNISRGDFAVLTSKMFKYYVSPSKTSDVFNDVKSDCFCAAEVSALKAMKIISGDENNCFRPNDPIMLIEAIKMISAGLGYTYYAENNGGYPDGYFSAATQANLLENINISLNDKLTKNEAVLLLYNALNADFFQTKVSGDSLKSESVNNENVLSEIHDVYYVDGIIKSNKITNISFHETNQNTIDIENLSLNCDDIDVKQYLGYNARVYYKNDNNFQNVIYIMPKKINRESEISDGSNAEYISDSNEIKYYEENGRAKKIKLEDNFKLIYNNKSEGDYNSILQKLDRCNIRFLDNNNNGRCDVLFVTEYKNVVVKSINIEDEIVYDMYSASNNWDWSNIASDAILNVTDTNGNTMTMSDLLPWRVLSISESNDREYIEIIVSDNFVCGTVSGSADDKYIIDGAEYEISDGYKKAGNQDLFVGLTGTFCLDISGRIAAVLKEDDGAIKYGFFISAREDDSEDVCHIKLYSQDGILRNFACANKVSNGKELIKQEKLFAQIKDICEQLIRYKTNSNGELIRFELMSEEPVFNNVADHNGFYQYKEEASRKYRKSVSTFKDDFLVNSQTLIFGMYPAVDDDKKYRKMELGNLINDNNYVVSAYTDKANPSFADVICIKFSDDSESFDWTPFAINKITAKINEDDEIINQISGYSAEGFITVETNDEFSVLETDIEEGDVVKIKRDFNGKVADLIKIYDRSTNSMAGENSGFNEKNGYHIIYPYAIADNTLKYTEGNVINVKKESQLKQKLMKSAVIVKESSQKNETYTVGNLNDIVTYSDDEENYSKIFMFSNYAEARLIVIINRE
ncbi:MAG: S-layer homology domain-containing protein [Clostridia bacterium]|nr:S-layer homology domain-containing protein [Clostridia bacterium]